MPQSTSTTPQRPTPRAQAVHAATQAVDAYPTAPLPPAAQTALAYLERALLPELTADRYRNASAHYRELAANSDFDGCLTAHDEMTMCICQLADAGRLDLIGPVTA